MHIDIRSRNLRLPRAHTQGLAQRLHALFGRLAHRVVRVVVRLAEAPGSRTAAKECTVEVHLPDGEVAVVNERQRKLGALLRRASDRAWKAAAAAIARRREHQPVLRLPPRGPGRHA
jgi:hypothetical protein